MTPEFRQLAIDVDRVWRNSHWKREGLAREALLGYRHLVSKLRQLDREDAARQARFLRHLDDVIADPTRVSTLSEYWWRRGITAAVAARMIEDRKAGREVGLPKWEPDPADVLRMGKYLEQLAARIAVEQEAKRVSDAIAADEAKAEAERVARAERDALIEPFREADEDALAQIGDLP